MEGPAQDHRDHDVAHCCGQQPYDGNGLQRREVCQGLHPQELDRAAQRARYATQSQ